MPDRRLSVVVPAHDSAATLPACLDALLSAAAGHGAEVVVVDDASRDGSAALAGERGATVIRTEDNVGPSCLNLDR